MENFPNEAPTVSITKVAKNGEKPQTLEAEIDK